MRKIKFRAWFNDEMHDDIYIFSKPFQTGCALLNEGIGDFYDGESRILMQFTGLFDKQGKEIYEGDIIEGKQLDYFLELNKVQRCAVEYQDGGFYPFVDNNDFMPYPKSENVEVIGNIYEDPGLLEVE